MIDVQLLSLRSKSAFEKKEALSKIFALAGNRKKSQTGKASAARFSFSGSTLRETDFMPAEILTVPLSD